MYSKKAYQLTLSRAHSEDPKVFIKALHAERFFKIFLKKLRESDLIGVSGDPKITAHTLGNDGMQKKVRAGNGRDDNSTVVFSAQIQTMPKLDVIDSNTEVKSSVSFILNQNPEEVKILSAIRQCLSDALMEYAGDRTGSLEQQLSEDDFVFTIRAEKQRGQGAERGF